MERILGPFSPYLYAVMRIVVGFLFASHGAQKLFGALGGMDGSGASASLFSMMGLAGLIEFFGGVLIMAGWLTGYVAFIASGEMAAAYFMAHHPRGFRAIGCDRSRTDDSGKGRAGHAQTMDHPDESRSGRPQPPPGADADGG